MQQCPKRFLTASDLTSEATLGGVEASMHFVGSGGKTSFHFLSQIPGCSDHGWDVAKVGNPISGSSQAIEQKVKSGGCSEDPEPGRMPGTQPLVGKLQS